MARQRLGQNFLTDRAVAGRIIRSAGVSADTAVLEVGPGRGALTHQLAASAGTLTVIELDRELVSSLRERYSGNHTVDIVEGDGRKVDPASLPLILGRPYTLIGNLPYYAATPIVRHFLESAHVPSQMIVMVQREVGEEMQAEPGAMSMLSLAVQVHADVSVIFTVPPDAFTPPPKVHSVVVRLSPHAEPLVPDGEQEEFFRIAKAGFYSPRKQLHNSLASGLNIGPSMAREIVTDAGIDPERRPATLSIAEWRALQAAWDRAGSPFVVHGTSRRGRATALRGG